MKPYLIFALMMFPALANATDLLVLDATVKDKTVSKERQPGLQGCYPKNGRSIEIMK